MNRVPEEFLDDGDNDDSFFDPDDVYFGGECLSDNKSDDDCNEKSEQLLRWLWYYDVENFMLLVY